MQDEDILIDWTRPLYINFVHSDIADKLTRLYEGAGTVERVLGDVWACEEPEKTEQIEDEPVDLEAEVEVGIAEADKFYLKSVVGYKY